MSLSLAEALQQVDIDLQVGQSYRCEVRGKVVEVRVLDQVPVGGSLIDDSDVLLDAWVELPMPQADHRMRVRLKRDASLPLDIPEIPQDEDTR